MSLLDDFEPPPGTKTLTTGPWPNEHESEKALDRVLTKLDLWRVHREVSGTLVQPSSAQVDKGMRIDRVLVPNGHLLELGWSQGIIGIEVKRPGEELGAAFSQSLDYRRSVFRLPGGFSVWLDWVFIWHAPATFGDLASAMQAQRIGTAGTTNWYTLALKTGGFNVLTAGRDGQIKILNPPVGQKAGHR